MLILFMYICLELLVDNTIEKIVKKYYYLYRFLSNSNIISSKTIIIVILKAV